MHCVLIQPNCGWDPSGWAGPYNEFRETARQLRLTDVQIYNQVVTWLEHVPWFDELFGVDFHGKMPISLSDDTDAAVAADMLRQLITCAEKCFAAYGSKRRLQFPPGGQPQRKQPHQQGQQHVHQQQPVRS